MYTEQDYQSNRKFLKKRLILLSIPAAVLLAGIVASFVIRIEVLTSLLTVILGCYCLFCYGMLIYPIRAHGKLIYDILHGRTHVMTGNFKEMDESIVLKDGVEFYAVLLNVGRMDNEEDDRLFYYDANLPRPDWQQGEQLTILYHDKAIGKWTRGPELA